MRAKSYTLVWVGFFFVSRLLYAAGSSCEGDECFFEEPTSKRVKKEREWVEQKPTLPSKSTVAPMEMQPAQTAKHGNPHLSKAKKKIKRDQIRTQAAASVSMEGSRLPVSGNIPNYMMRHDGANEHYSVGALVVNSKEIVEKISGVRDGDVLYASLPQKIKASPQAATSIRVTLLSGSRRGSYLMGTATLDPELKRVFLTFSKFRDREDDEVYVVEAEGQNLDGERGIEGEYHTEEGKFFLASLVTDFLGVLADSSVNRNQTVNGTWTQQPTLANSALTSAGATLVQQGGRLAQKAESAPQYTQTEGNQVIKVMIKSDPIRKL